MIDHRNYLKPDGRIDWRALERARFEAGEACTRCRGIILPPRGNAGVPATCAECDRMVRETGEVTHSTMLRCPWCRHIWDAVSLELDDNHGHLMDGPHDVRCPECDDEFQVDTLVTYTFRCPPVESKP